MPAARRVLTIVVALVVLGGAAGAFFYWRIHRPPETELVLYGNVDVREADLAFNVGGRVESMLVDEGDRVTKGQLLATLDATEYEAAAAAAEARVGAEKAAVDRLVHGSRPEEIKEARANVSTIEAELKDARATLRRTEKLVKDEFAPVQRLDDDRARVESLEGELKAAKQVLALAVLGPREEDIAEAKAELKADEAELALARKHLADTKLYAKDDGIVFTRILEPGAVVQPHTPVYTVALMDPLWVRTYVSEPKLGHIYPGMKAEVTTDSAPEKAYEGWVGFISPVAEFTPKTVETEELRTRLVYRLRVYVKNHDRGLRQGMPVTVRLLAGQAPGGKPGETVEGTTGAD